MRRRIFPNLLGDVSELEERQARLERILQVIGFSPEMPYTLIVNDGTLNKVLIGKVNGEYGMKMVNNAGATIIFADGHITADGITVGTLDADLVNVVNIHADEITVGYLSATRIKGGTLDFDYITAHAIKANEITAGKFISFNDRLYDQAVHGVKVQIGTMDANRIVAYSIQADQIATNAISSDKIVAGAVIASKINVTNLSAINANLGSITAGSITGVTITGGTIRTSASGQRVVLDSNNQVRLYASDGGLSQIYGYPGPSIRVVTSMLYSSGQLYFENIAAVSSLYLGPPNVEGSIYNIDWLEGYNDLKLKVSGSQKILFDSTENSNDLSMYPKWGDFYATGNKYFRIKHPDHPDEGWIQYSSVEAPEVALKIRGISKLNSGEATVKLPHHWELVTEDYLTTLQLTPCGDCNGLYAPKSSLSNKSFKVKELQGGTSNVEFMWELTATRKGYSDFNPEQTVREEIEKHAKALAESPLETETKKQYEARRQKKADEHEAFRKAVLKEYKKITGKDYVDKVKKWNEDDRMKIQEETERQVKEAIEAEEEVVKSGDKKTKKN